jgi:hypothetical protein
LFLRLGWKRDLIPFASLEKVLPLAEIFGLAWSNRLLVIPERGDTFKISGAELERFLTELARRCPELEQRPTDFGLSLQRPQVF